MRRVLGGAAWGAGALLAWSLFEPYRLVVERREAFLPDLPGSWEGVSVVLLSDFHLGLVGGNDATARRAVRRAVETRPAAVLVLGDFVHGARSAVGRSVALLRPLLDSGIPVVAVLGNHDYAMPTRRSQGDRELAEELARRLAEAGVRVLHNECVALTAPDGGDEPLYFVGLGSYTGGEDRPTEALAQLPDGAPRLVMMHHPASFDSLPPGTAPLAVAGHTHGGQVRLPFDPVMRYLTYVKDVRVLTAGWVEDGAMDGYGSSGNRLYVSRGVGCSAVPLRLFCPPEMTVLTLRRAAPR